MSDKELNVSIQEQPEVEFENLRTNRRKLSGFNKKLLTTVALMMGAYQVWISIVPGINPTNKRCIHLLFVLVLLYLLYPANKKSPMDRPSVIDWGCVVLAISSLAFLNYRFPLIAARAGRTIPLDLICGLIAMALVIEGTRRSTGMPLVYFAAVMFAYCWFGKYVPPPLRHGGYRFPRVISYLTISTEGLFGAILGVSTTYIFLFVLFAAILSATGMSEVFNDIAFALAGNQRGGPAKVATLGSAMMGTISGSVSVNVVTTGAFTIPLMKRTGYQSHYAGAVEAVASTGGQIMPPVMGSASFIIADTLGISYASVLRGALLPACLYFFSVWVMVDLRARRENIKGVPKEELPCIKTALRERGHLLLPLVCMIVMLVMEFTAVKAALYSGALAILSSYFKKETRMRPKELVSAFEKGAIEAVPIACVCAIIGIIVGVISMTGALLAISSAVIKLGQGIIAPTLVMTMIVSLILGMGLPTTACYIITATVSAPILLKLGVVPLAAHLFVFYFGILAAVTPPVSTGAYTAAGLAGSSPSKTGWSAFRLALAGFIIPYCFVYSPELLLTPGTPALVLLRVAVTSAIGIVCLGAAVEGYVNRKLRFIERVMAFCAAVLLIEGGVITDVVGLFITAVLFLLQYYSAKSGRGKPQPL